MFLIYRAKISCVNIKHPIEPYLQAGEQMSKLYRSSTRIKELITRVNKQKNESKKLINDHFACLTDALHKRREQLMHKLGISELRQQSILKELHDRINHGLIPPP